MKKIFLSLSFLFFSGIVYADEFRTWRSTEIRGVAIGAVAITTAAIIIHDVQVTSGSAISALCTIAISTSNFGVTRSSLTPIDVDEMGKPIELDIQVGRGGSWFVATTGQSTVLIRYNFTEKIPPGSESVGLKSTGAW